MKTALALLLMVLPAFAATQAETEVRAAVESWKQALIGEDPD